MMESHICWIISMECFHNFNVCQKYLLLFCIKMNKQKKTFDLLMLLKLCVIMFFFNFQHKMNMNIEY